VNRPLTAGHGHASHGPDAAATAPAAAAELLAGLAAFEDTSAYDLDAAMACADETERIAEETGATAVVMRARLVRARVWIRRAESAPAARVVWEVNAWAAEHGDRMLLARSHLALSAVYSNLGDLAAFLDHAVSALQLIADSAPPRTRVGSLVNLADALDRTGSLDAARERYTQAEQLAATVDDAKLQILVLNNFAYCQYEAGDIEAAWACAERMLAVAAASGREPGPYDMDTVARIQIARGRYAEAERTALTSIGNYAGGERAAGEAVLGELLLTLALAQRHRGDTEAAQATVSRCRAHCKQHSLTIVRVEALQEQAELYAVVGDFRAAYETHKEFHTAAGELVSEQREARARTRQAMFETTEARQEAERFREQARRDPLTGLHNRRYVDENLPALLVESARTGSPVVAALVDLDHFKSVNDTCSHEVGDTVLAAVATLLEAAVPGNPVDGAGFAARLGGEEFLLVLTGMSVTRAVERCERLRGSIAAHHWQPVTGTLPVTVSIGVTAAVAGDAQNDLLARADESLYTAKRNGRDQVCLDHRVTTGRRRYRDSD
jgi:diguanylate cyclase (GGDEF)-like protein